MVTLAHHQAARQNAHGTFENANIYVHFKHGYTLALKQRLGEGDFGHVIGAKKLFHTANMTICAAISRVATGV